MVYYKTIQEVKYPPNRPGYDCLLPAFIIGAITLATVLNSETEEDLVFWKFNYTAKYKIHVKVH